MTDFPEHAEINRAHWNRHADGWVAPGRRNWSSAKPSWGVWGISNDELPLLPEDMQGLDAIERGCGTAYVSEVEDSPRCARRREFLRGPCAR